MFHFSFSMKMLQNILGYLAVVHISGVCVICNGLYWYFIYKLYIYVYFVSVFLMLCSLLVCWIIFFVLCVSAEAEACLPLEVNHRGHLWCFCKGGSVVIQYAEHTCC
jgi:hypothetical protein